MSRILVVGLNYAPESAGTGRYTGELCEWLVGQGHEVRMITSAPHFPEWKVWPGYRADRFEVEQRNGVHVIRCPAWVPSEPNGLRRLLHLGSFALTSMAALLHSIDWRPQLVVNIAPTLASAPGAWLFARMVRARCWLHVQDFEVDAALDMDIIGSGPAHRLARAMEYWLLRRFDVVSTISRQMQERLADKGVDAQQQAFFPNWVDIDTIRPLAEPSPYRRQLGIPDDAVVALYSGSMGLGQGLEMLGDAAAALSRNPAVGSPDESLLPPLAGEAARRAGGPNESLLPPPAGEGARTAGGPNESLLPPLAGEGARRAEGGGNTPAHSTPAGLRSATNTARIHFVFGGQGPARTDLETACAHLPNVHFMDPQPIEHLRDWLGLADIHLLPQPAGPAARAMPLEITGMLASGRPILATAPPGSGLYHAVLGHGISTPPGDTQAFLCALATLANDPEMRRRLGTAARHRAEDTLSIHAVLSDFQHRFKGLLSGA